MLLFNEALQNPMPCSMYHKGCVEPTFGITVIEHIHLIFGFDSNVNICCDIGGRFLRVTSFAYMQMMFWVSSFTYSTVRSA